MSSPWRHPPLMRYKLDLMCKRGSIGQSEGLLIPRSSVLGATCLRKAPVPAAGLCPVVPAVVCPHVVPTHTAQMVFFCTSHVQPGPGCLDVGGDHLEECVYIQEA